MEDKKKQIKEQLEKTIDLVFDIQISLNESEIDSAG